MNADLDIAGATSPVSLCDPVDTRRQTVRFVVVLILLTFALRLPAFFVAVFNSDETYIATQAQVLDEGGHLYQDATDRKPPLVPYIYAATFALFGTDALWSVRVLGMIAILLTALLLAAEARRRYGVRAAWIAAVLLVLASVSFAPQDGQAANFEIFMLPAMTAAFVLAARGRSFSSGLAVGIATLAKQTGAATLLPIAYLIWRAHKGRGLRDLGAGTVLPLVAAALAVGPGNLVFWAVLGNGSYAGAGVLSAYVLGLFAVMTLAFVGPNLPILWSLPIAWKDRRARHDQDLWLWLASAALSVAVGFRFFGHYYLQLLPPLCLLTAGTLARMPRVLVRATVAVAAIVGIGFSIVGYFVQPFGGEPQYEAVSTYLKDHTHAQDRVLVWGHMPEIYWASGVRPATRFITTGFLTGFPRTAPTEPWSPDEATPGAWEMFTDDMRQHPPEYIVDTSPAAVRGSQYFPMSEFPQVEQIVTSRYRYVVTLDHFRVYVRSSPGPTVAAGTHPHGRSRAGEPALGSARTRAA